MSKQIVLVVDDSLDDLTLVQMAVKGIPFDFELHTANGGEEALAYLSGEGKFADRYNYPLPNLIVLDLKMPRVNGFDVLKKLQTMKLSPQPFVVVMSSSKLPEDIQKAESLGATAFHTKPAAFNDLKAMLGKVLSFFCKSPEERIVIPA
jgi:CheY-like chemotaxis protein